MPQAAGALSTSDLAERVLRRLTVLKVGGTPRPADAKVVTDAYEALYQEWFIRGFINWPLDLIPPYAAEGLVLALCSRLSPDFRGEPFATTEEYAETVYQKANKGPLSPASVRASYF